MMDVCQDILTKCPQEKDEEVKKAKRQEYAAGKMKSLFELVAQRAEESGSGWLCGSDMTIAGLCVWVWGCVYVCVCVCVCVHLSLFSCAWAPAMAMPPPPPTDALRSPVPDLCFYFVLAMIRGGTFDHVDAAYADAWPKLAALEKTVPEHPVYKAYTASKA